MKKRTKELSIPKSVKEAVARRDSFDGHPCCLTCGTPAPIDNPLAFSNAHFVRRSQGGLGVEENILTLCWSCHQRFDQHGEQREELRSYLMRNYKDWDEEKLKYRRD